MKKEIMIKNLDEAKGDFLHTLNTAIQVKGGTARSRTNFQMRRQGEIADTLLLKNILTATTICHILEPSEGKKFPKLTAPDFTSVAILTRSIVETFLTMHSICYCPDNEQEAEFQLLWWDWHDLKQQIQVRDNIRSKLPHTATFEAKEIEMRGKIEKHPLFSTLPKELLGGFKKGKMPKRALLRNNIQIAISAGILKEHFDVNYQMLSSIAHSQSLLVKSLKSHDPTLPVVNSMLLASTRCAIAYLSFSVVAYSGLFKNGQQFLDSRFLNIAKFWSDMYSSPFPED